MWTIQQKQFLVATSMVAASFGLISCGAPDAKTASETKAGSAAASLPAKVQATAFAEDNFVALEDEHGDYVSTAQLAAIAKVAFEEKLGAIGLIPTALPEYLHAEIALSDLEGCSLMYYAYCSGPFTFKVSVNVGEGPETIGESAMVAHFENLAPVEMKRRLRWTINTLVDQMVTDGLLQEIGVESPYY